MEEHPEDCGPNEDGGGGGDPGGAVAAVLVADAGRGAENEIIIGEEGGVEGEKEGKKTVVYLLTRRYPHTFRSPRA